MIPGPPKVIQGDPKSTQEPPKESPMSNLGRFWTYFGSHFGAKNNSILMFFCDIIFDTENDKCLMKKVDNF